MAKKKQKTYRKGSVFVQTVYNHDPKKRKVVTVREEYMLAQVAANLFNFISLKTGNRWTDHPVTLNPIKGITLEDLRRIEGVPPGENVTFKYKRKSVYK